MAEQNSKPRILILDTYYPSAIRSMPINPAGTYESELKAILHQSFGTADFYSRNLKALGWDAIVVLANHQHLQQLWASEHDCSGDILRAQIEYYEPDVIFLQDLNLNIPLQDAKILAGQISCPWPGDENIRKCDVIFTSFPHYVPRIEALGVKAVYVPLAFDPIVLERCANFRPEVDMTNIPDLDRQILKGIWPPRIHDVVFIGGVGNPGHWRKGMEVLNAVAEAIPTFKWCFAPDRSCAEYE